MLFFGGAYPPQKKQEKPFVEALFSIFLCFPSMGLRDANKNIRIISVRLINKKKKKLKGNSREFPNKVEILNRLIPNE